MSVSEYQMKSEMQQRFRVELLASTQLQPTETILVKEVLAKGKHDAVSIAVNLIKKEFPTVGWVKIDPWHVEEISSNG